MIHENAMRNPRDII